MADDVLMSISPLRTCGLLYRFPRSRGATLRRRSRRRGASGLLSKLGMERLIGTIQRIVDNFRVFRAAPQAAL